MVFDAQVYNVPKHTRRLCYKRSGREQPTAIKAHTVRLRIAVKIGKKIRGTHASQCVGGFYFRCHVRRFWNPKYIIWLDMNRFRKL